MTESPKWRIPVLRLSDHSRADLMLYAINGQLVMRPPYAEGAYILPSDSDGKLAEAIREARRFSERRQS